MAAKYPREYERVPDLSEVAPKDFIGNKRARDQRARDRSADTDRIIKLLKCISTYMHTCTKPLRVGQSCLATFF